MNTCIFCKIIRGEIPSTKVYEDDSLLAIRDIHPRAPVHILLIPKQHIFNLLSVKEEDQELLGKLLQTASVIAKNEGLQEKGARFVINAGEHGRQTVDHLHVHIMGGRKMDINQG